MADKPTPKVPIAVQRELAALRLAVQQLSDVLFLSHQTAPVIEDAQERVAYAAKCLDRVRAAAPICGRLASMLSLADADSCGDELFDDRMMLRLASRELEMSELGASEMA